MGTPSLPQSRSIQVTQVVHDVLEGKTRLESDTENAAIDHYYAAEEPLIIITINRALFTVSPKAYVPKAESPTSLANKDRNIWDFGLHLVVVILRSCVVGHTNTDLLLTALAGERQLRKQATIIN